MNPIVYKCILSTGTPCIYVYSDYNSGWYLQRNYVHPSTVCPSSVEDLELVRGDSSGWPMLDKWWAYMRVVKVFLVFI